MDKCHFRKLHIFKEVKPYSLQESIFLTYISRTQIVSIHLEDPLEMPDITAIRYQNQPDYTMEGSEGGACKEFILLSGK